MLQSAALPSSSAPELSMLIDSAIDWIERSCPVKPAHKFDREACLSRWRSITDLGWPGVAIAEAHGGSGLGFVALGAILTGLGRQLVSLPLLSNTLFADALLRTDLGGDLPRYLSRVLSGECIGAIALAQDGSGSLVAHASGSGWRLSGQARFVLDANVADFLLLFAAGSASGCYLLERTQLTCQPLDMIDGRDYAHVSAEDVTLPISSRLELDRSTIDELRNLARAGIAAEMIGACERALSITVDYLKTREQFGRKIGSFQALQHRSAQMVVDLELARSCVDAALRAIDSKSDEVGTLTALAKFMSGAALHRTSNEIVQMHGGIGMTDEHIAGRYLKWARVSERLFGSGDALTDDYAVSKGY